MRNLRTTARSALFGIVLVILFAVPVSAAPRPAEYVLPGNLVFPEGVAHRVGTDLFYVTSTTDGTIFRGNLNEPEAQVFLPGGGNGRTAAIGVEIDGFDRLFIAGGQTGQMWAYSASTKALLGVFNSGPGGFINDVAVGDTGHAYFTDSLRPVIWRVRSDQLTGGPGVPEPWLSLVGSAIAYRPGFNLNGIEKTSDGKFFIAIQSNTGKLFRIEEATKSIVEIRLPQGVALTNGDGMALQGHTLFVVRNSNKLISKLELSDDYSSATLISETTDQTFKFPTTNVIARGRMLVVNSQFDKRTMPPPELPFTVSSILIP